jgi:hypothetical protein
MNGVNECEANAPAAPVETDLVFSRMTSGDTEIPSNFKFKLKISPELDTFLTQPEIDSIDWKDHFRV